jgi:pSer/pThr/pTyr-binding forkhead associated (FHA) protein
MTPSNDETHIVFPDGEGQPGGGSTGSTGSSGSTGSTGRPDPTTDTAADTSREFESLESGDVERGLTVADQATVEALHEGTALLLVQRGPTSGARFLLDAEVTTVGRSPGNDIFLDDVTVSRKHAEFLRSGAVFSVRDVGSLNGTYVGRSRIDGEAVLHNGDEVQVGKFRFLFQQSDAGPGPAGSGGPGSAGSGGA